MVYDLTRDDEAALDINEDVPFTYVKEYLEITLWDANIADDVDVPIPPGSAEGRSISSLVYVDEERTDERLPREEYISRWNRDRRCGCKRSARGVL
jgi:gamma-glutamylcyclotransferase